MVSKTLLSMWYCWPRLGLEAIISFQEKIMLASILQRQLKGSRTQREESTGWKRGLTRAPLWRRQAEPLMRSTVKADRGNGKAYKGSVWWSAQKLGYFLWTCSKLPNLGWKPHELSPSQEISGSSCSFWKHHKRAYFYCCSLALQFAAWSNPGRLKAMKKQSWHFFSAVRDWIQVISLSVSGQSHSGHTQAVLHDKQTTSSL